MEVTITCNNTNKDVVLDNVKAVLNSYTDVQICILLSKVNAFKSIRINSTEDELYVGELGKKGFICNDFEEVLENTSKLISKYL